MVNKKSFLRRQLKAGRFDWFSSPEPPPALFRACHIGKYQVHGCNVFTIQPRGGRSCKSHVLYLHGGAYVQRFVRPHWSFMAELAREAGCTITAPDYPLAPAYTYKESFAMLEALYKQLIATAGPAGLILMGDSAGGGLALALAQKLKNDHVPAPARVILLSPWLDISLENPAIKDIEPVDPFLEKESLRQAGKLYAGGTDPAHYLLSPINGPLAGIGKITVFAGSREILVADTRKMKAAAASNGVDLDYREYPDMVHAWMLINLPESKRAKRQIIALLEQPHNFY